MGSALLLEKKKSHHLLGSLQKENGATTAGHFRVFFIHQYRHLCSIRKPPAASHYNSSHVSTLRRSRSSRPGLILIAASRTLPWLAAHDHLGLLGIVSPHLVNTSSQSCRPA